MKWLALPNPPVSKTHKQINIRPLVTISENANQRAPWERQVFGQRQSATALEKTSISQTPISDRLSNKCPSIVLYRLFQEKGE